MHQTLRIPEILLSIFSHCVLRTTSLPECSNTADLAVLARTCKTFREPALDVLWEVLLDLSPLVRCIPDACRLAAPAEKPRPYRMSGVVCYVFSRPLKEAEWNTLRGYARRVRFMGISIKPTSLNEATIRLIFSLAPFTDPLFPRLRSLCWREAFAVTPLHVAVPSLTTLRINFQFSPYPPTSGSLDIFGDRCPHIETFEANIREPGILDSEISRQICHWSYLRHVQCFGVVLNVEALLHLSSISTLEHLTFALEGDITHDMGSTLVFSHLTFLHINSPSLVIIGTFLSYIRLPATKTLCVTVSDHISRQAIQGYWTSVRSACSTHVTHLQFFSDRGHEDLPLHAEEVLLCLSIDVLRPCTAFRGLRGLHISLDCSVRLTDADLLELALPRMEELLINDDFGWRVGVDGGGITLGGLVQLLRRSPSLERVCLAIDTRTFTEIPAGLDVLFPPRRQLKINLVDSDILPEFVPGLVRVFSALGLGASALKACGVCDWFIRWGDPRPPLWERVLAMLSTPRTGSSSTEM